MLRLVSRILLGLPSSCCRTWTRSVEVVVGFWIPFVQSGSTRQFCSWEPQTILGPAKRPTGAASEATACPHTVGVWIDRHGTAAVMFLPLSLFWFFCVPHLLYTSDAVSVSLYYCAFTQIPQLVTCSKYLIFFALLFSHTSSDIYVSDSETSHATVTLVPVTPGPKLAAERKLAPQPSLRFQSSAVK